MSLGVNTIGAAGPLWRPRYRQPECPLWRLAMDWDEVIEQWRRLPPDEQRRISLSRIPGNVARSMAFESEPVDPQMLETELKRLDAASRCVTTTLGVMSGTELAPHLARRVQRVELDISQGRLAERVLDETLILDLHHRICGELVPEIAGRWRRVAVSVGGHAVPAFVRVGPLMRDYVLDLQARSSKLGDALDHRLLGFLAFAEVRLLSIHPFRDFDGRTTRLLLAELLRRQRLPPVTPDGADERERYLMALQAADHADWQPLIVAWMNRFEEEALQSSISSSVGLSGQPTTTHFGRQIRGHES